METFLIFLAAWMVAGIVLNLVFGRKLKEAIYVADGYSKGYMEGITNLKMHYYVTGEMPDIHWLQKMQHKDLSTREKYEAVINPSSE